MKIRIAKVLGVFTELVLVGTLSTQGSGQSVTSTAASSNVPKCGAANAKVFLNTAVRGIQTKSYINGLTAEKFRLSSEGETHQLQCFSEMDQPITVGFVLDYSSSTAKSTTGTALEAIKGFVEESNLHNLYFAVGFTGEPFVMLESTSDRSKIDEFLRQAALRERRGKTGLNDALLTALDTMARDSHPRKMLILVSDGLDTNSRTTDDKLVKRLRGANIRIFSAGVVDPPDKMTIVSLPGESRLRRIAAETGGTVATSTKEDLAEYFKRLAKYRRNEYLLGLSPTKAMSKWRPLKFEINVPKGFEQISIVGIERFYY